MAFLMGAGAQPGGRARNTDPGELDIVPRALPFPFQAMMAICSDLDETRDGRVYLETMRYLNTRETTIFGEGLGLEVGNSIYFDMPDGLFSYWNALEAERESVRNLIRSGHIDCLHSFGDGATTRADAGRGLEELSRHGCRLEVWIDHGVAPTNFGADIMRGYGDLPGADAYHADLTCGFGIRYVWRGRITSVIGQNVPRSLAGIGNWTHPFASLRTVAKEGAKGLIGNAGHEKYAMHGENRVLSDVKLRDERRVKEFLRANPYWGGVDRSATADGLENVITETTLDRLCERGGCLVLYTHLGRSLNRSEPLGEGARRALGLLARYSGERKILVTTTRRLLGYCAAASAASISVARQNSEMTISIENSVGDGGEEGFRGDLQGYTIYVPDPERTRVHVCGREVRRLSRNGPDHTGRKSVSITWTPLRYPGR